MEGKGLQRLGEATPLRIYSVRFHQARIFSSPRASFSKISGLNDTKKVRYDNKTTSAQPAIIITDDC